MGNKAVSISNWEEYEEDDYLSYSYLKKKGKHKRAKTSPKNRSV